MKIIAGKASVVKPPKKKNRDGSMSDAKQRSDESKKKRLQQFSPKENKQVALTVKRNVNAKKAIEEGATLNEAGMYKGDQRHKKSSKGATIRPKFSKTKY